MGQGRPNSFASDKEPSGLYAASLTDEGRYRLLVEAVTDYAIYMIDVNGIVTSWNPGARRFKGYEEAEILGQHFSRFYTEEDRQAGLPAKALATAAREGKFEGEGWRIRKDGTRFWASVIIDPIRDPSQNLVGYAKITRDLTERRAQLDHLAQPSAVRRRAAEMSPPLGGRIWIEAPRRMPVPVAADATATAAVVQSALQRRKATIRLDPEYEPPRRRSAPWAETEGEPGQLVSGAGRGYR